MKKNHIYYFSGVVHPERAEMSTRYDISSIECKSTNGNVNGTLDVSIRDSQISAIFRSPGQINDLTDVRNALQEVISSIVDSIGYYQGCGYTVEIRHVSWQEDSNGKVARQFFSTDIYDIQKRYEPTDREMVIEDIPKLISRALDLFQLSNGEAGLCFRLCLADLRMAILSNVQTPFYCYRAIEALCQHCDEIANRGHKGEALWNAFWRFIGDDGTYEEYVRNELKPAADDVRHGNYLRREFDRGKALKITWDVVDKYISEC